MITVKGLDYVAYKRINSKIKGWTDGKELNVPEGSYDVILSDLIKFEIGPCSNNILITDPDGKYTFLYKEEFEVIEIK